MKRQIITGYVCNVVNVNQLSDHKTISMTLACISADTIKYVPVIIPARKTTNRIKKGARLTVSGYMIKHTYLSRDFTKETITEMIAESIQKN